MKAKIKDIAIRTLKTFIEGFVAALPVTLSMTQFEDKAYMTSLLIAALAAGTCAVLNTVLAYLKKYTNEEEK